MIKKILIADDESLIREFIINYFQSTDEFSTCKVDLAVNGEDAIARINTCEYDVIFTDLKMPIKSGLEVVKYAKENSPSTDVVLMTAYGGGDSAAKAMSWGAYEYITKPVSIDELEMIIRHIFERRDLIRQNEELQQKVLQNSSFPRLVGNSKAISDVFDLVKMVAPTQSTVLITGDSGTGKELVAEAIHALSPRATHNYIRVNCAALPEHLIESELFGFEKGSFTGAIKKTRGKFELADGGTILLDEISEMNLDLQVKLLRVIQEREITRIGSEISTKINTRIIATSNRDLKEEIKKGNFREDLYFRLNILPIRIPPLLARKSDIPLLVDSFVQKICFEMAIPKKNISSEAVDFLMQYDWPGNIRELRNVIERALIITRTDTLTPASFMFLGVDHTPVPTIEPSVELNADYLNIAGKTLAMIEKEIIYFALDKTNNNKAEAARILGVTSRTLRNKLKLYDEGLV